MESSVPNSVGESLEIIRLPLLLYTVPVKVLAPDKLKVPVPDLE